MRTPSELSHTPVRGEQVGDPLGLAEVDQRAVLDQQPGEITLRQQALQRFHARQCDRRRSAAPQWSEPVELGRSSPWTRATPPRPRPTGRRSRPSWPSTCRPGWTGPRRPRPRGPDGASWPTGARILADNDLLAVAWPKEYGGAGLSLIERTVLAEELTRAGAAVGRRQRRLLDLACSATRCCTGAPRSRSATSCPASSPARTCGARATPSPTRAPTWPRSAPGPCSTATSG